VTQLRTLIWMIATLLVAACATVPVNLPAITDAPTDVRLPGKIIWHDLLTSTPKTSQQFYEELFGWEFEKIGLNFGALASANYTLIRHNGKLIGGMIDQTQLRTKADISQWVVLMSTDDIDKAVATVTAAGGTVFTPPTSLADRGRIAVVADPQGALFALLETRDGDPVDAGDPPVNGFLWNELWATDAGAAADFYRHLVGFDIEKKAVSGINVYRFLTASGVPRAGILSNPIEELPPLWTTYIRVEDPAAICARVEALGGRILLAPEARDLGGTVALIAGPSGAGIALQTWEPDPRQARNAAETGK
jgi:predicted enzyme related to lactoylglutathione lyase